MNEMALVVNSTLQDNLEEALAIDELLGSLRWEEDGDVSAVHTSHGVGEAHPVEAGDGLLWVYKTNEVIGQGVLVDQAHFQGGLSCCGPPIPKWLAVSISSQGWSASRW